MSKEKIFPDSVSYMEELLRSELKDSFDSDLVNRKRALLSLDNSVLRHSIMLEVETSYPFFVKSKNKREIKKKMLDSHKCAWDYAVENIGSKQSYDHTDLNIIAKLIAPYQVIHPQKGYRTYSAEISGATHDTTKPSEIHDEVSELIDRVNQMKSPLEKALYSHFHIARIHPFEDGNGRTSRIVQNSLLCGANLLPITIAPFQRDLYIAILDDSVNDYNANSKQYLYTFSEFLIHNLYFDLKNYKNKVAHSKQKDSK